MGQQQYVVQYNDVTDLYLVVYDPDYNNCKWGNAESALTWTTLEGAQAMAASIGHGTVGTPKPH
jgi:hypothetical protein